MTQTPRTLTPIDAPPLAPRPAETEERYAAAEYARIIWHSEECMGRHGTVPNVARADVAKVADMLVYYFGAKCEFVKTYPGVRTTVDFEFVPMSKVFPPPNRPWEWCGKSVLFDEARLSNEARRREAAQSVAAFKVGDRVSFVSKGATVVGLVTGVNKRLSVVVEGQESKWYVPGRMATKVGG